MGDSGRRRPPLRCNNDLMDGRPRRRSPELTRRDLEIQRVSSPEVDRVENESAKEIDMVISMLADNCSLDTELLETNIKDVLIYFESLNSTISKRQFLVTTFALSLEDREFARSAGPLFGVMHTIKIEGETVRSFLLTEVQKELEDNDFRSGNRQRFLNAVFLLSELYYHIRFNDQPIGVLGGELLKYFRWLLTGEEKELEVLSTCIIVNGTILKKDKPASYRKLLLDIRTTLVTRNLSPQSRSWLLLVVDMDNVNFDCLPEELVMCHMSLIGDEGFQKFKRVRPSITRPSSPCDKTDKMKSEKRDHRTPESHFSGKQVVYDVWETREKHNSEKQHSAANLPPAEDWETELQNSPPKNRSSDDWLPSDSQKNVSRVTYKRGETQNRSQRPAPNYTGRPLLGNGSRRNVDVWTDPPPVQPTFKGDKKVPTWQQHDDRFDRDYDD